MAQYEKVNASITFKRHHAPLLTLFGVICMGIGILFAFTNVKAITSYTSDHSALLYSSVDKKVGYIETGGFYSCALTTERSAFCAGLNDNGQLGNPMTTNQTPPVQFQLPTDKIASTIKVGTYHSCALTIDQLVYCVGLNSNGQLGDNSLTNRTTPVPFALPAGKFAASVSTLANFTCVLTTSQEVYCAGLNASGQLGNICSGTCGTPVKFRLPTTPTAKYASAVATTYNFACALTTDQEVWCAGYNQYGQLGDDTVANQFTPKKFLLAPGTIATSISIATFQTCAITGDQSVWCAGRNNYGQLGNGNITDQRVPVKFQIPGDKATMVSASSNHICALSINRTVYCAGLNTSGQLGNGTFNTTNSTSPLLPFILPAGVTASYVTTTPDYTCVVTTDQYVYCAGQNGAGQLGDETTSPRATPVKFKIPDDKEATAVSIAFAHTCVLTVEQLVYCAGYNLEGQLGNGLFISSSTPVNFIL